MYVCMQHQVKKQEVIVVCDKIPKIIHYVWLGNKSKSKSIKKYINTWKTNMSDFQFIEWNESNFDINFSTYTKEAYNSGKYAYVSDVIRIYALSKYGGIYLDTDVEVLKDMNLLLDNKSFLGFESDSRLSTAIIGAQKGIDWIDDILLQYQQESFLDKKGNPKLWTNVERITKYMVENRGLVLNNCEQNLDNIKIYSQKVFSPIDMDSGKLSIDDNTITVHWQKGSWVPLKSKVNKKVYRLLKIISRTLKK